MKTHLKQLLKESGYYGHVLSKRLPKGLDNRLYTLISMIGGDITTTDVVNFAEHATPQQVQYLYEKVRQFPSKIDEVLPYAGGYKSLKDSKQYQEIINLVKFKEILGDDIIKEDVSIDADGYHATDTNPYFTQYFQPQFKSKLFKYWDSLGEPDYDALKLFGVVADENEEDYTDFRNVGDVVYPLLVLEWLGGVENTEFAKAPWMETSEMGFNKLKFKVEPIQFDYMFDESVNFGEQGYACWDIRVLIDKMGDFGSSDSTLVDEPFIQVLFPESSRNKLSNFRNYTNDQMELIEMLWDEYEGYRPMVRQFCSVEVVLV